MSDSYKHPKWQRKRLEILARDQWACTACGDTESTLHVHHATYDGEPWEAQDSWLQTLCESCHELLGPHPKAGVYWHKKDADLPAVVAVCWCPQCAGLRFKDKGSYIKCLSCGWDCGHYVDRGFVVGQKVEVSNDEPAAKKEYSLAWLKGIVTKARKGGASDIQLFEAIFPAHPAVSMVQLAHDVAKDFIAAKLDGQLSLEQEIAAVSALVTLRRKIEDILIENAGRTANG